ncbi:transposase [Desulfotomaculum defluvii]
MGRKPRVWYPGAIYHVICRGNHRLNIFRDDEDRIIFLSILSELRKEYSYHVLCYCLMTNHFHMIVETLEHSITQIMTKFNWRYVKYFNKKYQFVGRLYQDRFIAKLITDDKQLLENSRYIHLNPVNTKVPLCEDITQYPWSSYQYFIIKEKDDLLKPEKILNIFGDNSQEKYKKYVEAERSPLIEK